MERLDSVGGFGDQIKSAVSPAAVKETETGQLNIERRQRTAGQVELWNRLFKFRDRPERVNQGDVGHPAPVVTIVLSAHLLDGPPNLIRGYDDHGALISLCGRSRWLRRAAGRVRRTGAVMQGPHRRPFQPGLFPPAALQRFATFVVAVFAESSAHGFD